MASSKIKRNQSASSIYWLLGAITITGIVFMFWPQEDTYIKLRANLKFSGDERAIINSYLRWNKGASVNGMTVNHDFNAEGLRKLAKALSVLSTAVSQRVGEKSGSKINTIKDVAALIVVEPGTPEHADQLRDAFIAANYILTLVQTRAFPELKNEIKLLNEKVCTVKAEKLMFEQKKEIIAVYRHIGDIVTIMTSFESSGLMSIEDSSHPVDDEH